MRRTHTSWLTANYTRAESLPNLRECIEQNGGAEPQTDEEQLEVGRMIAATYGGGRRAG